jgi:hypothetical protein
MVDEKEAGVRHYGGSECRVSLRDRLLSGSEGGEDAGKMAGGGERVGMGGADAVACQVAAVVRPGEATDEEVKEMMRFLEARLAGGRAGREEEPGKHGLLRLGVGVGGDVRGAGVAAAAAAATSVATPVTASSSDSRFDVQLDASKGEREGQQEATVSRSPPPTPNVGADGGVVVDEDEQGEAQERSLAEEGKVSAGESGSDYEL